MTHPHFYLDRFYWAVAALIVCTVINAAIHVINRRHSHRRF